MDIQQENNTLMRLMLIYRLVRTKRLLRTIALLAMIMFVTSSYSQDFNPKLQSIFIYQTTHYFHWPDDPLTTFNIGVIGETPLVRELKKLAVVKKIKNMKIVIKEFTDVASISSCQILFIPYKESSKILEIKNAIEGQQTLIISEKPKMASEGSCINFVNIDGNMKFELNKSSYVEHGLKAMPMIEKLSILVF